MYAAVLICVQFEMKTLTPIYIYQTTINDL